MTGILIFFFFSINKKKTWKGIIVNDDICTLFCTGMTHEYYMNGYS